MNKGTEKEKEYALRKVHPGGSISYTVLDADNLHFN